MALPAPEQYNDWREYARALISALQEESDADSSLSYGQALPPNMLPSMPTGYLPVWWDVDSALLYMGNHAFDPPDAPALFTINTQNLTDAAIETAKIADGAVTGVKIPAATIDTLHVKDAAIVTAKIADAAIVSALIGDAQIVTAKIADLAVNTAKMANLSVTSAKIALLAVGNAHIQDAAITSAKIEDASIVRAKIADAAIGSAQIEDAAIGTAKIANAAVGTAQIADASILSAKIGLAQILAANIGLAQISSAHIAELVVNRLTSGQLDAVVDVEDGLLRFTVDATQLVLGNGFGSADQFFLWYGPTQTTVADYTEANGVIYLKTSGDAYFGGALSAGTLRNTARTTLTTDTATIAMGPFGSNGNPRVVVVSYFFKRESQFTGPVAPSSSGTIDAQIVLEKWNGSSWDILSTMNLTGSSEQLYDTSAEEGRVEEQIVGSTTYTDSSGGLSVSYQARIVTRNELSLTPGAGGATAGTLDTQTLSLISTEE